MPGVSHESHLKDAKDLIAQIQGMSKSSNLVIDDTVAGLIAGKGNLNGICAFSGSGSSVLNGSPLRLLPEIAPRPFKVDGYGPLLGDRGSGFRISVELLSRALKLWDMIGCDDIHKNPELDLLYRWLVAGDSKLRDINGTQVWFDTLISRSLSQSLGEHEPDILPWSVSLAHLNRTAVREVDNAYRTGTLEKESKGPNSALSIASTAISRAALDMATSTRIAIDSSGETDDTSLPIVCQGGMFINSDYYFNEYKKNMEGYKGEISRSDFSPVVGALTVSVNTAIKAAPGEIETPQKTSSIYSSYSNVVDFIKENLPRVENSEKFWYSIKRSS
jgi:hypothetical protein